MKTLHLSIIAVLSIMLLVNTGIAYAQEGGPVMRGPSSYISQISSSGNDVYIVWSNYDPKENVYHALFRTSNDGGKSFGNIVSMGNSFNGPTFSQMASHENNLYIALGNTLKKSSDYGNTFEDKIPVSTPTGGISNIVATENNVYLTFDNVINSGNSFEILFAASNDNGTTFGNPVKLFGMPESSEDYSQIAASGTNVYVVGEGKYGGIQGPIGVLYRASRDGGTTFSNTVDLSNNNSTDFAPKVATSGNYVYVAWSEITSDKKNSDLIFRVSKDGGETFGPKIKINQDNNSTGMYNTDFIQLATYDSIVYVKWWDVHFMPNGAETDHLMFKRIIDGDTTIGKTIELTGNDAKPMDIGQDSIVSVTGNNVYVSWLEFPSQLMPGQHTFFRKSSDGGFSFDGIVDLNRQINETFGLSNMKMTGYGNNVYVAGDTGSQTRELFFRASNDNGTTFSNMVDLNEITSVPQQISYNQTTTQTKPIANPECVNKIMAQEHAQDVPIDNVRALDLATNYTPYKTKTLGHNYTLNRIYHDFSIDSCTAQLKDVVVEFTEKNSAGRSLITITEDLGLDRVKTMDISQVDELVTPVGSYMTPVAPQIDSYLIPFIILVIGSISVAVFFIFRIRKKK